MGDVRTLSDVNPEIRVVVHTTGRLELANVGRFLQRLDTAARRAAPEHIRRPRIEVVEITSGSLVIRIAVVSLVVAVGSLVFDAGSFAVSVADYLRSDPAATRASRALLEGDNATSISIEGGGVTHEIESDDLLPEEYAAAGNRAPSRGRLREIAEVEVLTGPQTGFIRRFGGENWIELDSRPGLIIRIRDEREDEPTRLVENARYTLHGEAHIGHAQEESYFLLRNAMLLK